MVKFGMGERRVVETEIGGVTRYSVDEIRVYRIAVESFPSHITNVYLILDGEVSLVDTGFDGERARKDLTEGLDVVGRDFGESIGFEDITNIIITHGHGDHCGMLAYDKLKGKRVYIHELDSGLIKDYDGAGLIWRECVRKSAREAGCDLDMEAMNSYQIDMKASDHQLVEIRDESQIVNGYEVYHTPGHTPGHICLKVGPVLFLGDHMLSVTTPHQVPKSGWQGAGLRTYLDSLRKVAALGAELGLAGHEDSIYSVQRRADEIEAFHRWRLEELVEMCREEKTLYQLTGKYYRLHTEFIQASCIEELVPDDKTLALEEIKAHVEYLLEDDRMVVTGIDDGVVRYCSR